MKYSIICISTGKFQATKCLSRIIQNALSGAGNCPSFDDRCRGWGKHRPLQNRTSWSLPSALYELSTTCTKAQRLTERCRRDIDIAEPTGQADSSQEGRARLQSCRKRGQNALELRYALPKPMESGFQCAACGEWNTTSVDESAGLRQNYVEDCQVCCKPNVLHVEYDNSSQEFFITAELE